jgi:trehalose-phosphatase
VIGGRPGFLLEDKDQAIALHAKWAEPDDALPVLDASRQTAAGLIDSTHFRILDGDRFLEVAPSSADKGRAAEWFAAQLATGRPLPVYFGDDDKDAAAFDPIRRRGGISIGVTSRFALPTADVHLPSHAAVRDWLRSILSAAG